VEKRPATNGVLALAEREASPEWETPDCLLCGGRRQAVVVRAYDNAAPWSWQRFRVVRCLDCGLHLTNPRPSPERMAEYYPDWYEPHESPEPGRRLPWRPLIASWCGWPLEARRVLPWHGRGRLLDFGCGGGSFLDRMHRQGWQVTGIDISPVAVERIREKLGLHALLGSLPHKALAPGSFDVVTMWHSLEHVHEPLTVLREAYRLLAPGGRLLVAVPNIASLPFQWFGPAWYGLDLPRHLTHFSPATLNAMLLKAGFRNPQVRMLRHSRWLRASAQLACQNTAILGWHRWLAGKITSRLITMFCLLIRQSDCILVMAERASKPLTV
jgi:2-polyprenyl-3-methyl-5-hydroxy-6-metoxy-1,4-benzoquinol methylase